jgi:hypothetical protein
VFGSQAAWWIVRSRLPVTTNVWWGKVICLEILPDAVNVVQLGRIFQQPFDREPVSAGGKRGMRHLAGVDRPLSSTSTTGLIGWLGLRPYRRSSCSRWAMKSLLRSIAILCAQ